LPSPLACWVMSAGISSRRVAIRLAAAFRDEVDDIGYQALLDWLSNLSSERLRNDFDLTGLLLEDVSRSIFTVSTNKLLRQFSGLDVLPREVNIQGIQYQNRRFVALALQNGDAVQLIRDYDETMDRNAIAIRYRNQDVGYVPRDLAEILAPEMDIGSTLQAVTVEVDKRLEVPSVKIRIVVAEESTGT